MRSVEESGSTTAGCLTPGAAGRAAPAAGPRVPSRGLRRCRGHPHSARSLIGNAGGTGLELRKAQAGSRARISSGPGGRDVLLHARGEPGRFPGH
jgi:hypothetical protein